MAKQQHPHPMGEPVPGKYFTFVKTVQVVKYHTLICASEDGTQAMALARKAYDNGDLNCMTIETTDLSVRVEPVREKHIIQEKDIYRGS